MIIPEHSAASATRRCTGIAAVSCGSEPELLVPANAKRVMAVRILVVEDDEDCRDALVDYLELLGLTTSSAGTAADAMSSAATFEPDIVLCDLVLPGELTGWDLAEILRRTERCIRLIAVTGLSGIEHRRRARDAGFDEYLVKPVYPDRLIAAITGTVH